MNRKSPVPLSQLVDTQSTDLEYSSLQPLPVQLTIHQLLLQFKNIPQLDYIFQNEKPGAAWRMAMDLMGNELQRVTQNHMVVPEYTQKSCALQVVYIFIGTHWEVMMPQLYFDFVRDACRLMGLQPQHISNHEKMNNMFENLAFRLSRFITTARPAEGVWINLRNGTLEVHTAVGRPQLHFREHRAADFFKYALPYCYDPDAQCPRWQTFLNEVLPEQHSQTLLAEYLGYCFTQNLKLEKMAVFYGTGANGKSVCLDVIKRIFGRTNVSEATLSSITTDPETRSLLQDKLVNLSSESGRNLNMAVLKQMISGEPVEMRLLYKGTRQLYNPPKLITSYNELPPVDNSYALKRRWLLFPFNLTVTEDRQDPALVEKLEVELPGILNWIMLHLQQLLTRMALTPGGSFTRSEQCVEALNRYFNSANSISMFLDECCKAAPEANNKMRDIYATYVKYCSATGITKPSILKKFKKALQDWGATITVDSVTHAAYANVFVEMPY